MDGLVNSGCSGEFGDGTLLGHMESPAGWEENGHGRPFSGVSHAGMSKIVRNKN